MCNEAFDAWLSLFNENAANAWIVERKELRNTAMLLSVLDLELREIRKAVSNEFHTWQKRLNSIETYRGPSQVSPRSRKNILKEQNENKAPGCDTLAGIKPLRDPNNQSLLNWGTLGPAHSPDESGIDLDKRSTGSPERDQIVINESCVSPKINKTWKYSRLKRARETPSSLSLLDVAKSPSKILVEDTFACTPDKTCDETKDFIETTIIDVTPEPPQEAKKIRHSKIGSLMHQKKKKKLKEQRNSTLTQMFSNVAASTKREENIKQDDDSTYCPIINIESSCSGRQNPDDPSEKDDDDDSDFTFCPIAEVKRGDDKERLAETEFCGPKFREPAKKFGCKVQNSPSYSRKGSNTPSITKVPFKFKTKPVRGKARMKLEGWDCDECRRFYEYVAGNAAEAKELMNKCSRHRDKFKPDDYTAPGFWDLKFTPTQHAEENVSTVYNLDLT